MQLPRAPHKEDIKAAIFKTGITLVHLSMEHGLNRDTVANSLRFPIPAANRAIAERLGVSLNHLWPDWYDTQGKRISLRSAYKHSASGGGSRRKKTARNLTKNGSAA